ncbi:MAG: hypothetical protein QGH60_18275 [Phycisphaerae bacterium]|nr:hypothetical protein [Phycisphaerae bacterium]
MKEVLSYSAFALVCFLFYYFVWAPYGEKQRQARDVAERQKSEATTRKAADEKAEKQRKIAEIAKKFSAVYFPPEGINDESFTYEIQKFFKEHAGDTIVFKGRLEDVEASKENAIVEFTCIGQRHAYNAQWPRHRRYRRRRV